MSMLESLPAEVFGHILDRRGITRNDAVPVCSTRCKEMWLEFAERRTRAMGAEFVRPFEFAEGSTLAQRYYEVIRASLSFLRQAKEVKSIEITKVEEIIKSVRSLLERNPVRRREVWMLERCTNKAISAQTTLNQVPRSLRDNVTLQRLSDVAISIADRSKALLDRGGGDEERDLCVKALCGAANFCLIKNPSDRETSFDLANRALALDPLCMGALCMESLVHLDRGNIDLSFAAIQRAMRSACSDSRRALHAGRLSKYVAKRRRQYGTVRTIGLLREAVSSLNDLLAEDESILEERRNKIVTEKGEIEELLGRLTGRQD